MPLFRDSTDQIAVAKQHSTAICLLTQLFVASFVKSEYEIPHGSPIPVSGWNCSYSSRLIPIPGRPECSSPTFAEKTAIVTSAHIYRVRPDIPEVTGYHCAAITTAYHCNVGFWGSEDKFAIQVESYPLTEQEILDARHAGDGETMYEIGDFQEYQCSWPRLLIVKRRRVTCQKLQLMVHPRLSDKGYKVVLPRWQTVKTNETFVVQGSEMYHWKPIHTAFCMIERIASDACLRRKTGVLACPNLKMILHLESRFPSDFITGCDSTSASMFRSKEHIIVGLAHKAGMETLPITRDLPDSPIMSTGQMEFALTTLYNKTEMERLTLHHDTCLLSQSVWDIAIGSLGSDPTHAARSLLRREDIIADYVDGGLLLTECRREEILLDPNPKFCDIRWPLKGTPKSFDTRDRTIVNSLPKSFCTYAGPRHFIKNETHAWIQKCKGCNAELVVRPTTRFSYESSYYDANIPSGELYSLRELQRDQIASASVREVAAELNELKTTLVHFNVIPTKDPSSQYSSPYSGISDYVKRIWNSTWHGVIGVLLVLMFSLLIVCKILSFVLYGPRRH